jgi:hypothetical protein
MKNSALFYAAIYEELSLVHYFLNEADASISDATSHGSTVWTLLKLKNADPFALAFLLKVLVMLDDAPPGATASLGLRALNPACCAAANRR